MSHGPSLARKHPFGRLSAERQTKDPKTCGDATLDSSPLQRPYSVARHGALMGIMCWEGFLCSWSLRSFKDVLTGARPIPLVSLHLVKVRHDLKTFNDPGLNMYFGNPLGGKFPKIPQTSQAKLFLQSFANQMGPHPVRRWQSNLGQHKNPRAHSHAHTHTAWCRVCVCVFVGWEWVARG